MRALDFAWCARTNDETIARRITHLYDACRVDAADGTHGAAGTGGTGVDGRHEYVLDRRIDDGRASTTVSLDGEPLLPRASDALALAFLAWDLNERARAATSGALLVHAAAVELDGDVVLLPGTSGAGKSTLAAALVADGFRYLTDEIAAIDLSTCIARPYPKPLALHRDAWNLLRAFRAYPPPADASQRTEHLVAPQDIPGGASARRGGQPRLLLFPSRGATRTEVRAISRAQTVVSLATHTGNFESLGPGTLAAVAAVVGACRGFELHVGDPDDVAPLTRELLATRREAT
jgi:hypothetical protein